MQRAQSIYGSLDQSQISHFHQQGYLVIRGLISPEVVDLAKRTIDDFINEHPTEVQYEPEILSARKPDELTPAERIVAVRGIHQQVFKDERFLSLAKNSALIEALISLLGSNIKVLQDMALIKPPRIGSEKPAHQDAAYFEIEPLDQIVGTWWALDTATAENGCMFVWPGTHRLPVIPHTHREGTPHLVLDETMAGAVTAEPLPMDSGDVLLFSSRLFHFTPPNRSNRRRRALQIHYASAHCRLLAGKPARKYTLVHGNSQRHGI